MLKRHDLTSMGTCIFNDRFVGIEFHSTWIIRHVESRRSAKPTFKQVTWHSINAVKLLLPL